VAIKSGLGRESSLEGKPFLGHLKVAAQGLLGDAGELTEIVFPVSGAHQVFVSPALRVGMGGFVVVQIVCGRSRVDNIGIEFLKKRVLHEFLLNRLNKLQP